MSLLGGDLRTFLIADATITGLVVQRVYPNALPQNPTYPAITYNQVSGVRVRNLKGPSGTAQPRISINAWASTYLGARSLADAIRQRIDGYSGLMGSTVVGNVILDNEIDFFEDQVLVHRVLQDYFIFNEET